MDRNNILALFRADPKKTFDDLVTTVVARDGFKREKAARHLGELGNPAALPHLIERANDWVPQVRTAAYEAILKLRRPGAALEFIAALPALDHLESCLRTDHSDLIAQVHDFLCSDQNRDVLLAQMSADDSRIARIVCRLVMKRKLLGAEEMLRRCLSSKDVFVRSLASENLRTLDVQAFDAVIERALSDPFMPVRREAFQQLLARDPPRGLTAARTFLFDRHVSVREIAVAHLLRDGFDVRETYDDAFANGARVKELTCIIWAWAELGRTERIDAIKRLTESPSPTIRRTALQALATLIGKEADAFLLASLLDKAPSVCTASSRLIVRLGIDVPVERLISIARTSRTTATVRACCNVAVMGNKWNWLLLVLDLYSDEVEIVVQEFMEVQLREWNLKFNRSATQPTRTQIESIERVTRMCIQKVDKRLFAEIAFALKMYGGTV